MPKFAVVSFTDETPSVTLPIDPAATLPFVFEGGEFIVSDFERTRFPAATVSGINVETRKLSPKRDALAAKVDALRATAIAALLEFVPELDSLPPAKEDQLVYLAHRIVEWNTAAYRLRKMAEPKERKSRTASPKTEKPAKAAKAPKTKAKKGA